MCCRMRGTRRRLWCSVRRPGMAPNGGRRRQTVVELGMHGGRVVAAVEWANKVAVDLALATAKAMAPVASRGDDWSSGGRRLEAANGDGSSASRWERRCGGGRGKGNGCWGEAWGSDADGGNGAARRWRERQLEAAGACRRAATRGSSVGGAMEGAEGSGKWGKRARGARGPLL